MKRCGHTHWLSLCRRGGEAALLQSDRLQTLISHIPNPDSQNASLFVLIGNGEKSAALRALFGVKRARGFTVKRSHGEAHLHMDPSTVFCDRPILLVDGDMPKPDANEEQHAKMESCHEVTRHSLRQPHCGDRSASDIYTRLLFPFADVFCLFAADLDGLTQTARHLALWLDRGCSSGMATRPGIVVVTDKIAGTEEDARRGFLGMLREETTKDPFAQVSSIDVVGLAPSSAVSADARYRRVKERVMGRSDQVRRNRQDARALFSVTHLSALLTHASAHFSESMDKPFDFVTASRVHNPVAPNLHEHLANFLAHIKSSKQLVGFAAPAIASALFLDSYPPQAHAFGPAAVFGTLYKEALGGTSESRAIAFEESSDVILRSGLINMVQDHFEQCFDEFASDAAPTAVDIHRSNLTRLQGYWRHVHSSNTCLCCLRRRPQYCLPCGHSVCENCVVVLGRRCEDDPWVFRVGRCFLCGHDIPSGIAVRTHPPTAGVGILCIDGGGARGIVPLAMMKLIQDRLGPIPMQRCFKLGFGVSVGVIIAIDHFLFGRPIEESMKTFSGMAGRVFKRRLSSSLPLVSRVSEAVLSYLSDGLYSEKNVDAVLQEWATTKRILDISKATTTGTKVGLPVATVSSHPSHRFFTNYNGAGERGSDEERAIIKPQDGFGNAPLWEIARSASAAPGFFPPKHISGVGTFQDVGALENDPVIWALSEAAAMSPFAAEPDFVISLGTGEPGQRNYDVSTEDCRSIWKNGMYQRLRGLVFEKMRDKSVRRAYKAVGLGTRVLHKVHRLSLAFETTEPRLDDVNSIPELISQVEKDPGLIARADRAVHCLIASLFYFELDSPPERRDGKYAVTGKILCSMRRSESGFDALCRRPLVSGAGFLVNDWPVAESAQGPSYLGEDGNFRLRVKVETSDSFTLCLKGSEGKSYSISGSPFSVERLVAAQGFGASFGRADHGKRKRWVGEGERPPLKRRRKA